MKFQYERVPCTDYTPTPHTMKVGPVYVGAVVMKGLFTNLLVRPAYIGGDWETPEKYAQKVLQERLLARQKEVEDLQAVLGELSQPSLFQEES